MSTTTSTLLATATTETLPLSTPAMARARFERTYRGAHGAGEEVPAEVHTAPLWAGPDSAEAHEAHEALCAELADEASTLETVGDEGYVLLRGAGDGCDVWARYTTA